MRKEKLVTNDIYFFLTETARASAALSLLWEFADAAPTPERIDATVFLISEISDRMCALEYFLGESGDLSKILAEYKNKFDIYALLAERKKEITNKED
ncbi:hypothetical protein AIT68_003673 [Salmonella enterica subsp. salamae]|uniref:hypothetical protein n=1 Tax=Salmonella enterica TaxID=28901 RepID=UPI0009E90278|nr:hypothetical protein [Salmonella enterica]EBQ5244461.1 hypothetical protein [Salmonella enterica subsp. salamae]